MSSLRLMILVGLAILVINFALLYVATRVIRAAWGSP